MKIFTDNIENTALEQIGRLMSIGTFSGCKVRIMPDSSSRSTAAEKLTFTP